MPLNDRRRRRYGNFEKYYITSVICSVTGGLRWPVKLRNHHTFSPTKTISGRKRVAGQILYSFRILFPYIILDQVSSTHPTRRVTYSTGYPPGLVDCCLHPDVVTNSGLVDCCLQSDVVTNSGLVDCCLHPDVVTNSGL